MNGEAPKSSTVIVFAREPAPGKTKTRLASRIGAVNSALLADAFLRDTLAKVAALRTRLVIAADTPRGVKKSRYFLGLARAYGTALVDQAAGDLGARMSRALKPYAQNGRAILIGSDVPSLPSDHLKRALELLGEFNVVLGPALDGGYYLLGVRGALPGIFHRMPWGERGVLYETLRRLRAAQVHYALAPCWYDVDDSGALAILAAHLFSDDRFGVLLNSRLPLGRGCPCPATAEVLDRLGIQHSASF